MGGSSRDFFGGALDFVAAVLNALFRVDASQNPRMSVWTSDSPSLGEMSASPETFVSTSTTTTTTTPAVPMQQRVHDEIAALKQIDPDFSELQFVSQATAQYLSYLLADSQGSADALSAIATPTFAESQRAVFKNRSDAGLRRVSHDVKMIGSAIIKVSIDGSRQAIVLRLSSSGVRFVQDIDTASAVEGSAQTDSFTEFATFVRPAGTTTPKSAAAGGTTHCPACGAPTTAGMAVCPFCGTNVTGTGSTWLLDKISASAYT